MIVYIQYKTKCNKNAVFYRWRSQNRIHEMVQASGLVLDFGGSGVFRSGSQHDWRLAQGSVQENKRGGMLCQTKMSFD